MSAPNVADALSRAGAATSNFLSSFTASLGGGSLSSLFDSLLSATQNAVTPQISAAPQNASAPNLVSSSSDNNGATQGNAAALTGNLGDLAGALHGFVAKWSGSGNNNAHSGNNQPSSSAPTNNAPNNASTPTTSPQAVGAQTQANANSAGSSSGATVNVATPSPTDAASNAQDNSSSSDPAAPPSLADLLAGLQTILQMLQQQIQIQTAQVPSIGNAPPAPAVDDANGGNAAPSAQDLLAAGGALGDLLALAQMLEKSLGLTSSGGATQAAAGASGPVDPNLAALDVQLRANLKTLLDNLNAAATAAGGATVATGASAADNATLLTTVTPPTPSVAPSTPDAIIKGALATADNFLQQLNNLPGAAVAAPVLAAAVATDSLVSAGGKDGSPPGTGGGNANASTTTTTGKAPGADPLAATAETPKSPNPYSFASQLSATRALNGGTVGLPSAVEQVLLLLNRNAKSGNDQMTLQLYPAELGSINIKLDLASDGAVRGTVTASNPDTLAMLQNDSSSLERALADAGLRADPGSLQFSLGGQANDNSGQTTGDPSSGGSGSSDALSPADLAALAAGADSATIDGWIISPGRVNITV
jgi:flagellar hook-length control protein FliK